MLRYVLAALAVSLVASASYASPNPAKNSDECPASSPRFRVGHTIKSLNVTGTLGETRPIQIHVWYPARDQDDCDEAADFDQGPGGCHAPLAVYTSRLYGVSLSPTPWSPLSWTEPSSKAFENARVARGEKPFPAIVFSHGAANNVVDHAYLLEDLASYGYIVAAPDHLNNTQDDAQIDFVNSTAVKEGLITPGQTVLPCFDGTASPCQTLNVERTMADRVHDVGAVYDALPVWFGPRVDTERVGMMGHSRGSVTTLAIGGGSPKTAWNFPPDRRFKALMGLSIGIPSITFNVALSQITAPTLLVEGTRDQAGPPPFVQISQTVVSIINSPPNPNNTARLVIITDAFHRSFASALCAQTQNAASIAQANPSALLDLNTANLNVVMNPGNGVAMDYCPYSAFINPTDITGFIYSITKPPFQVVGPSPTNVPRNPSGLTSSMAKDKVVNLAVAFFGRELNRADGDDRPFTDCLPDEFKNQPPVPDLTQQDLNDAELHADESD